MEIISKDKINKLHPCILSNVNNKNLNINFSNSENIKQINTFLYSNKNIINYYFTDGYTISIDLIEKDFKIYLWLIDCIQQAYIKITNSTKYIKLFENPSQWNISVCENIMFNFPFTLSNIIYLPISYIELCSRTDDKKKFVNTLIHEKIHLGQRSKEHEWEKFINLNSKNWIKIKSDNSMFFLIDKLINNNGVGDGNGDGDGDGTGNMNYCFISNPDTFYSNFKYVYFDENTYYYGQYMFNKKSLSIEKKYFQFNKKKKLFEHTIKELEEEHPYEIYAYKIADELN